MQQVTVFLPGNPAPGQDVAVDGPIQVDVTAKVLPDSVVVEVDYLGSQASTGVPIGGLVGQALVKNSNMDFDTKWSDSVLMADKWTVARTFTISGDASGTVLVDGSGDFNMALNVSSAGSADTWTTPRTITAIGDASGTVTLDGSSDENFALTINYAANAGNAATADKWTTARTITLTGEASGNTLIDGSSNVSINVTGIQSAIDASIGTHSGGREGINAHITDAERTSWNGKFDKTGGTITGVTTFTEAVNLTSPHSLSQQEDASNSLVRYDYLTSRVGVALSKATALLDNNTGGEVLKRVCRLSGLASVGEGARLKLTGAEGAAANNTQGFIYELYVQQGSSPAGYAGALLVHGAQNLSSVVARFYYVDASTVDIVISMPSYSLNTLVEVIYPDPGVTVTMLGDEGHSGSYFECNRMAFSGPI